MYKSKHVDVTSYHEAAAVADARHHVAWQRIAVHSNPAICQQKHEYCERKSNNLHLRQDMKPSIKNE